MNLTDKEIPIAPKGVSSMNRLMTVMAMLAIGGQAWAGESDALPLNPRVRMQTTLGDMVLELNAERRRFPFRISCSTPRTVSTTVRSFTA